LDDNIGVTHGLDFWPRFCKQNFKNHDVKCEVERRRELRSDFKGKSLG